MRRPTIWGPALLLLMLVGCRAVPAASPPEVDAGLGWVLWVRAEGPRWLGPDWWRAQGIDLEHLGPEYVRLQQAGAPVAFLWLDTPSGPGLLFYGKTESSRDGSVGAYVLSIAETKVSQFTIRNPQFSEEAVTFSAISSESSAFFQTSTRVETRLEQDVVYRSTAPLELPWLWASFNAPAALTLTVPLTEALSAPVTLTLRFWGQSAMPQNPDHHICTRWNDVVVDDHTWDGAAVETWSAPVPSARAGDNILVLESPGDTGAPVEVTWLDAVSLNWLRPLRGAGAGWEMWLADDAPVACWSGLPTGDVQVLWIDETREVYDGGVYQNAGAPPLCVPQIANGRGWIGLPWEAPAPDTVRPRQVVSETALLDVAYLLIAPEMAHVALMPLVEARREAGLSAGLVTPEQVYERYGAGLPGGDAIRQAVLALHARGRLRYVLLVGDASADPRALWLAEPSDLFVPTLWVRTSYLGETPSDHALVTDDAGEAMVAVGRFPASTVAEVRAMVEKTLRWEPTTRQLLLNDDEAEFVEMTDVLAALSLPPFDSAPHDGAPHDDAPHDDAPHDDAPHDDAPHDDAPHRLDATRDSARRDVLDWLRAGPGILVYSGHGSLPVLGDEKLLTVEDAGAWQGPTIVMAWTCLCANFTHSSQLGLSEAWLRDRRGVVAVVGPTGETTTVQQLPMALAFQRAVVDGATLGDALLAGWAAAQSADVRAGFLLLGDPALQPFPADGR